MQDPFLSVKETMHFLDTKRTTMQLTSIEGKLGHMPQEDYASSFTPLLLTYLDGGDVSVKGIKQVTKRDIVDASE